jgi:transposase
MPSLITKWKGGNPYLYWVRSARVKGQPRIVEQVYLGPKARVLQEIHEIFTKGSTAPPPELKRVQVREFGASALFWSLAQEVGLVDLIDAVVPSPPRDRCTSLSVGQYLVLAAINRVICPHSKRSFAQWYETTVLRRWVDVSSTTLTSPRFWDHMEMVTCSHIQQIQEALVAKLADRYGMDRKVLIYDTTNYYTFISTFNARASLPQRGRNKQRRTDLRQLSLAAVLDEASGLPVYHRCYEGNVTDVTALVPLLDDLLAVVTSDAASSCGSTLIMDKGNVSMENLHAVRAVGFSFIAAIPATWESLLWDLPLSAYASVEVGTKTRVKVAKQTPSAWDRALGIDTGKAVIVFSPSFYRKQVRTLDLLQHKADLQLHQVAASLSNSRRGESAVRKEIAQIVHRDLLSQYFSYTLSIDGKRVVGMQWHWDPQQKVTLKHQHFGRTLLYTDRKELSAQRIVELYRQQAQIEALFRISKTRRPGLWWPAYHWTDTKLRVHALTCFLGLLLIQIVLNRLHDHHIALGVESLMEQLRGIQEARIVYADGTAQRVLTELTPQQEDLCDALNIYDLATQMGNTLLNL